MSLFRTPTGFWNWDDDYMGYGGYGKYYQPLRDHEVLLQEALYANWPKAGSAPAFDYLAQCYNKYCLKEGEEPLGKAPAHL